MKTKLMEKIDKPNGEILTSEIATLIKLFYLYTLNLSQML